MSRADCPHDGHCPSFPRVSGDEPPKKLADFNGFMFSPRERG